VLTYEIGTNFISFREKKRVDVYLLTLYNGPWNGLPQVHVLGVVQDHWPEIQLGLQIA